MPRSERPMVFRFSMLIASAHSSGQDELKRLVALYEQELATFKLDTKAAAQKMASSELGKPSENLNLEELAAWTVVGNVLLNLDETITKGIADELPIHVKRSARAACASRGDIFSARARWGSAALRWLRAAE